MANKGSEWSKWDLHIHSPFSYLNNQFKCDLDTYCKSIIDKNISVIGLTNYFYISKKEFKEVENRLKGKCLVIPNYEFRISDKNKDSEFINIHILFNPTINIDKINQCISEVNLNNISSETRVGCNIENLKKFGFDAVTVSFDELTDKLKEHFIHKRDF